MNHKRWALLVFLLVIFVAFLAPSCAKKELKTEPTMSEEEARRQAEEEARRREQERQAAIKEEALKEEAFRAEGERIQTARERFENEDVLFEFDSASLTAEAQEILREKAEWLRDNPSARVIIEGHCDERGTNEYNLALGDRRAYSSKAFLTDLGIEDSRLTTISYGEEQPIAAGSTEDAWAKNRRAHFVIK
ncbi:MAG: peptidoglycan-associated lipoprotein Pal [Desulfobacterales bacterium]|nr:peptidoglycan-associated lipoprotein Pal [Desulfobacterales bacterium]